MIRVSHLTKRYGPHIAVDDISFEVQKGEVLGFLGPNGAGKTTTLRILTGFLGPTSGTVEISEHDVEREPLEARRCIGYMPETAALYPEMRVVEYLFFRAELKRVPSSTRRAFVDDAMRKAGVLDVAHRRIGHLSKGYRQRVGLADALVARPPIVVLDEPTAGLDPNQIRDVRDLVRKLGRDHTVVLSTHILSEAEACSTRVVLIHRGKIAAAGTIDEVRQMRGMAGIEVTVRAEATAAEGVLRGVDGIVDVHRIEGGGERVAGGTSVLTLRAMFGEPIAGDERANVVERCVAALVGSGVGIRDVRPLAGSLEDAFASLTRDASKASDS